MRCSEPNFNTADVTIYAWITLPAPELHLDNPVIAFQCLKYCYRVKASMHWNNYIAKIGKLSIFMFLRNDLVIYNFKSVRKEDRQVFCQTWRLGHKFDEPHWNERIKRGEGQLGYSETNLRRIMTYVCSWERNPLLCHSKRHCCASLSFPAVDVALPHRWHINTWSRYGTPEVKINTPFWNDY